ncbi:MAG: glycosyl transferase [Cyclobacteriaceae bacterium]
MSESKKVLIISYYWPPLAGSGVQRWLKFVKYFPANGIIPIIFTPRDPYFNLKDPSLLKDIPPEAEVLHFPIFEPYRLFERFKKIFRVGSSGNSTLSQPSGIAAFIRSNFFIPDPRIFWVRPSVQFLENFIKENEINTIVTTGPPHSIHLIGLKLCKKIPDLAWLADFRDPWTTWGFLLGMKPSWPAMRIHRSLEKKVLGKASAVTTVSPFYARQLSLLGNRSVDVITNGFDADDFQDLNFRPASKFIIRHVGILHPVCNPEPFLAVFKKWVLEHGLEDMVEIHFTGLINRTLQELLSKDELFIKIIKVQQPVGHRKLISLYEETSALLLILTGYKDAEGFLPGKLFEYLATGLPLIAVGPSCGDAAGIIHRSGAGKMAESDDTETMTNELNIAFDHWSKKSSVSPMPAVALEFSRAYLAGKMAELLKKLKNEK